MILQQRFYSSWVLSVPFISNRTSRCLTQACRQLEHWQDQAHEGKDQNDQAQNTRDSAKVSALRGLLQGEGTEQDECRRCQYKQQHHRMDQDLTRQVQGDVEFQSPGAQHHAREKNLESQ